MAKSKKQPESIPSAETINEALPAKIADTGSRDKVAISVGPPDMLSMFSVSPELADKFKNGKVKRLTLPPIIKPASVGPGRGFMGKIVRVIDSPVSTYKSKLLVMEHPTGGPFCWPANAVTCGALANFLGIKRESFNLDDPGHQKKVIGATLAVEGLGASRHSDGKRTVNLYNIAAILD